MIARTSYIFVFTYLAELFHHLMYVLFVINLDKWEIHFLGCKTLICSLFKLDISKNACFSILCFFSLDAVLKNKLTSTFEARKDLLCLCSSMKSVTSCV